MNVKICKKCKSEKPVGEFYKCAGNGDGLQSYCRMCAKAFPMSRETQKKKAIRSKERYRLLKSDPEFQKQLSKHKETFASKHPSYSQDYYKRNKDKFKEYRERYKKSPGAAIQRRLRERLRGVIKSCERKASFKRARKNSLVGCPTQFLAGWIESKFQPGMSWENRHLWHVDHIIPCASFDLTDKQQVAQCFHYSNLQPLWAKDNMAKSDKVPSGHTMELPIPIGPI